MLDMLWKNHLEAGLQMLFHNTSPLGSQAQPTIFIFHILGEAQKAGPICEAK